MRFWKLSDRAFKGVDQYLKKKKKLSFATIPIVIRVGTISEAIVSRSYIDHQLLVNYKVLDRRFHMTVPCHAIICVPTFLSNNMSLHPISELLLLVLLFAKCVKLQLITLDDWPDWQVQQVICLNNLKHSILAGGITQCLSTTVPQHTVVPWKKSTNFT